MSKKMSKQITLSTILDYINNVESTDIPRFVNLLTEFFRQEKDSKVLGLRKSVDRDGDIGIIDYLTTLIHNLDSIQGE